MISLFVTSKHMKLCPLDSRSWRLLRFVHPRLRGRFRHSPLFCFCIWNVCRGLICFNFLKFSIPELLSFHRISSFNTPYPLIRRRNLLSKSPVFGIRRWIFVQIVFKRFKSSNRSWSFILWRLFIIAEISSISEYFLIGSLSLVFSNFLLRSTLVVILF